MQLLTLPAPGRASVTRNLRGRPNSLRSQHMALECQATPFGGGLFAATEATAGPAAGGSCAAAHNPASEGRIADDAAFPYSALSASPHDGMLVVIGVIVVTGDRPAVIADCHRAHVPWLENPGALGKAGERDLAVPGEENS